MAAAGDSGFKCEGTKPMPTKRVFGSAVQVGDVVYIVGGCDHRGLPLDVFEGYNLKKGKWDRLQPLITKRAGSTVVVVDGKIFVVSGVAVNQEPLDTVEMYTIKEKKWTTLQNLKEKLLGVSAVVRDKKVYIVGGMALDSSPRDYFMCYEMDKSAWKSLAPMPTPRYASTSLLIGDKLYVIGGRQGKIPVTSFEMYDFVEEKWTTLPNVPSKRVFAMYTTNNTHIFSIGGLNQQAQEGFSDACEVYDIEKGEWIIGTSMPTKRGDFAIGVVGNKVVCAGGLGNEGKPLKTVEAYDHASNNWTSLADMPSTHCSCANMSQNGKLFAAGGLSVGGPSAQFVIISMK